MCIFLAGVAVIVVYDAAFHEIDKRIEEKKRKQEE